MFKGQKLIKYLMILILILAIIAPFVIYANTYEELPKMKRVFPDEAITIPFEKPLSPATIINKNIYVKDSKDNIIPISTSIGKDFKSIIIEPLERGYEPGQTYTLYIERGVKYLTGRNIEPGLKMEFTIIDLIAEKLPTIGTLENFEKLIEESQDENLYDYGPIRGGAMFNDMAVSAMESAAPTGSVQKKAKSEEADFSGTNIQVEGVDEADIVKTDGEYLYKVNNENIVIAKIYPSDNMKLIETIKLGEEKLKPLELYVDEERLLVIGTSINDIPIYRPMEKSMGKSINIYPPPYYSYSTVKLIEYNIKDKTHIKKSREIELEGNYLSSRKIEDTLYLVSNKYLNRYYIMDDYNENITPAYKDTAIKDEFINIPLDEISYFPDCIGRNYLLVAAVDFSKPEEGANVSTYLGNGENIYASTENLYITVSKYNIKPRNPIIHDSAKPNDIEVSAYNERETLVYRFAYNGNKLYYSGKGTVPGDILNQFSMDEDKGYFRIATTKPKPSNNLYILDNNMKITGSVEDIAPGERIYSVRFMGDRAYMVTFKTVDPLFVIDLKDAKNPKILGALKIPGYSDYLHPYDENHIIGFGKDTIEIINKDRNGKETGRTAHYLGMKLALFDVSDVNNPIEKYSEKIGDRGTESELLYNHKALLFSKERNLMAFPVTLMEVKGKDKGLDGDRIPTYGDFVFQGAYIYNIDLDKGFKLKSKISHINDEDYKKAGMSWYNSESNIDRIIYIGDDLYTLSNNKIRAHDINSIKEKGELIIGH